MSFFADFSEYSYFARTCRPKTLNVGWLDVTQPFSSGVVPPAFLDSLWTYCINPIVMHRGFHECNLCSAASSPLYAERNGSRLSLGACEIRVFGLDDVIYAAPDLIYHYVRDHDYLPPDEFVRAVIAQPLPGTVEYKAKSAALGFTLVDRRAFNVIAD